MVSTVSQQGRVVKRHMNQEVTYMSGCTPRLSLKCRMEGGVVRVVYGGWYSEGGVVRVV